MRLLPAMVRRLVGLLALLGFAAAPVAVRAGETPRLEAERARFSAVLVPEEFRAFWVDAFHAGIRTPAEAEQLVADAKKAHLNALIVQVRRRGDALYKQSFEPPLDDPAYDPTFDALAHIIEVAHREGLEVHAWVNAMVVWRDLTPPHDPRHVFNQHGPVQTGEANWLTATPQGEQRFPVGYFLDPGHPAAAAYVAEVYLNIVRHYAVDGIHFDYIRYPETSERLPRGAPVGYNATSLARFRQATGRTDTPAPEDPQWTRWRQQQVTQMVRRVYVEAKAINPRLKVSAAVVAWGVPPRGERDFAQTAPAQRVFQDWHGWLKEGIIDLALPMNYARETEPTVRRWFDGWIRWEKRHKHGRQVAVGIGAYLNAPAATLAQVARARRPEGKKHRVDGISVFSYANLFPVPPADSASTSAVMSDVTPLDSERVAFFSRGSPPEPSAFPHPAAIPKMDWLENPTRGWLAGMVADADRMGADGVGVALKRAGWWPFRRTLRTLADSNGFFGFTNLRPGRYRLRWETPGRRAHDVEVEILAGRVTRLELLRVRD